LTGSLTAILGCDYGARRIGLAVAHPGTGVALGIDTLEANTPEEAARRVAAAAAEREVGEIVVGLPLTSRGERGQQAEATEVFVEALRRHFAGPIHLWDERLTSVQSERAMAEMGEGRRGRKGTVDRIAATLLLQSYLDSRNRTSPPE
jgi:putative Holliday junction resolvase